MTSEAPALTLFHHIRGNQLIKPPEEGEPQTIHPNKEQLSRRHAIIPDQPSENQETSSQGCCSSDNVIIVPHVQISPNESHLFNRAISSGGGLLADLQRATIASQAFYAEASEPQKNRSPWILKRLYEWSGRAKRREIIKHVQAALETSKDHEIEDDELEKLLPVSFEEMFMGDETTTIPSSKHKYLQAVWELFHTELVFLYRQLFVLRDVYKEPLKRCQVEGCLLLVEPDLLFGNLDQLCRISRTFCQSFLSLLSTVDKENWDCTQLVVDLFERFSKGPSTISAYQAYCINYKATMEYLGSIRQKEERFTEFERICLADERCFRLQLEDLLIAPLQRITRLPILLREIHKRSEEEESKGKVEKVIDTMTESLRSIDDSVQWLHNFERLQQLQTQVVWPNISDLEPKSYVPDFLRVALSRQFCENLLAHPRRKLIHEGPLELVENGRTVDMYAFLFNDMFVLTKTKKCASKLKVKGVPIGKSEHYIVQRQPVPLDSCVFCDADSNDQATPMSLKFAFVIIHLTRYYQVVGIYTLQAADKADKELWIEKFQESIENYESIQLKDMLKCTPLFSSLSLRRCSSSRLMSKSESNSPQLPKEKEKEKEEKKECCSSSTCNNQAPP
ncbi:Pleckstrin homology domain-containing family G member 7 [Caenorhabditis elegans]|uniref:Pleckstrin homology domain-containing family G member 7 n=1 Tax=Caenorhabditis elegans TaxID=6239 RepID=H2L0P8_CAEEL|nr:Pleckstrin homology domain-containing family G member 7 [Caenorhabditis elegans]CCD73555.1 Pleckstrin homology domain-containing family G member 7 [Caenorhabditis elegans]|eukprot:NP_001122559.1 Pleckstrin homology and RHoGef (RhoGEF) domain containing [Caenorhabditis elegans]